MLGEAVCTLDLVVIIAIHTMCVLNQSILPTYGVNASEDRATFGRYARGPLTSVGSGFFNRCQATPMGEGLVRMCARLQ